MSTSHLALCSELLGDDQQLDRGRQDRRLHLKGSEKAAEGQGKAVGTKQWKVKERQLKKMQWNAKGRQ